MSKEEGNNRRNRFERWNGVTEWSMMDVSLVRHNTKYMVDIEICKAERSVGIMACVRFILLLLFLRY